MKRFIILLLCLVGCQLLALAQEPRLLTAEEFIALVRQHHPLAHAATLEVEKAKAMLTAARGGFDPLLAYSNATKDFKGVDYYNINEGSLTVPTPFALNVKAGMEYNQGYYLNPQLSRGRTSYAGLEIPLGNGLLFDKRRAELLQARINLQWAEQETRSRMNSLLLDAYSSYFSWAASYQLNELYGRFINNNEERIKMVRLAWQQGERPAIDTLEAVVQMKSFILLKREAEAELQTARLQLNSFLWNNQEAIADTMNIAPVPLSSLSADIAIEAPGIVVNTNPLLQQARLKLGSLDVERRLKFQSLLPYLNVKANLLNENYQPFKNINPNYAAGNHSFGINLSIPLRLSAARGEYRLARLKIEQAKLELSAKTMELNNKVLALTNEVKLLEQQLATAIEMYNDYSTLLRAEEIRFANGEGSLFIINNRELKVIEALQKLVQLRLKWLNTANKMQGITGVLQ